MLFDEISGDPDPNRLLPIIPCIMQPVLHRTNVRQVFN